MKKALYITGMYLLVQLGIGLIISLYTVISTLSKGNASIEDKAAMEIVIQPSVMLISLVIASALTFLFAILICQKGFKAPFEWKGSSSRKAKIIILSLLTMLPLVLFSNSLTEVLELSDIMEDNFKMMSASSWALCVMAMIGPLAEEVCFRYGIAGSLLKQKGYTPWLAITVSALIFGIIHMNPAQMLGATVLGMYFGWLFVKTNSIWPSLLCHIFNNALAVIMLQYMSYDFKIASLLPSQSYMYLLIVGSIIVAVPFILLLNRCFTTK